MQQVKDKLTENERKHYITYLTQHLEGIAICNTGSGRIIP